MNSNKNTFTLFQSFNDIIEGLRNIAAELAGSGKSGHRIFNAGEAFGSLQRLAYYPEPETAAKLKQSPQSCEMEYFLAYSG